MTTTCERKARYSTEGLATAAARRATWAAREIIKPYLCDNCGGWHIGHLPLRALRRK